VVFQTGEERDMYDWYDHPIDRRASAGGERGVNGKLYKGGEYLPFYVPRPEMPQVNAEDYPALLAYAKRQGVKTVLRTVPPRSLHAHQRVNWDRLRTMPPEVYAKPALASADDYVLDGNHRWWAHELKGEDLKALFLSLQFEAAIRFLFSFPRTYAGLTEAGGV
jgi:hypothetical protein